MTLRRTTAYLLLMTSLMTSLPNTYYAASMNHINRVLEVTEDEILQKEEAPILSMKLMDDLEEEAIFYIELSGAKYLSEPYEGRLIGNSGNATLEVKSINAQKLQVKVKGGTIVSGTTIQIPLPLQMTGDTAIATVKSNNTVVSGGTYILAQASSYKGKVGTGEVPTTTHSGVMADLLIEEPFSKAFSKAVKMGKSNRIELRLNHNAYAFSLADSNVQLVPMEGFEGRITEDFGIRQIDAQTLELILPDTSGAQYTGSFTLSGIYIQLTDKTSALDCLTVTVSGDLIETTTVDVLEVMDYAITLKGTSQRARAGSRQTVYFTLQEQVEHSLIHNRPTYFTFTNDVVPTVVNGKVPVYLNGILTQCPTIVENGKVVGFEISRLPDQLKTYNIKTEVQVNPTTSGNIKVIADGRSLVEPLSLTLLDVYKPFEVSIQGFDALVGIKDQKGGQVVLKENRSGEWIQGEKIILSLEQSNIQYSGMPEILVTSGDLRLGTPQIIGNRIEIPVVRSSHTASTIIIRDFKVTVDQTIASGNYVLQIGGGAFSTLATADNLMPVAQGVLIQVSTKPIQPPSMPNEEVTLPKPTTQAIFTLGQTTYSVGEAVKVMDAMPYISNGRTMLPIKYVSEAIGISADRIHWNGQTKTVTIYASQIITLQLGSLIMTVGGEKVKMSAVPELVNGRTFVPVAEITRALNVVTQWDHVKKQVTFMV